MMTIYVLLALLVLALPLAWWLGARRAASATPPLPPPGDAERWANLHAMLATLQRVIDDQARTIIALEERTKHLAAKAESHADGLHKITSLSEQDLKAQEKIHASLHQAQMLLAEMKADYKARLSAWEGVEERVAAIHANMLGSQSKGAIGENVLAELLGALPPDMIRTQFKVKNASVEFALMLPSGKCVPIDSKMGENFEKDVRDVQKYLDPDLTESYAILAVPDARYNETRSEHYKAFERGVYVVSFGMLLPYLLTLLQLQRRYQQSVSTERLHAFVERMEKATASLSDKLESHMARGLVTLQNAFQESRELVGQIRGFLAQLKAMDEV